MGGLAVFIDLSSVANRSPFSRKILYAPCNVAPAVPQDLMLSDNGLSLCSAVLS